MYTILQSDGGNSHTHTHTPKNDVEISGIYCIIVSCFMNIKIKSSTSTSSFD